MYKDRGLGEEWKKEEAHQLPLSRYSFSSNIFPNPVSSHRALTPYSRTIGCSQETWNQPLSRSFFCARKLRLSMSFSLQ